MDIVVGLSIVAFANVNYSTDEEYDRKTSNDPIEVTLVLRRDFQQVKWVRDGNYAICAVCADLAAQQKKGFKSEALALEWRQKSQVHNKVHRANRIGSMNSEYTASGFLYHATCRLANYSVHNQCRASFVQTPDWSKKNSENYVLLLVNSDYDWRGYFEQCRNKHLKHYKRPLAYQYEAGDVASKYLPGVRYKVWGHAEQKWRGENDSVEGKDLRPYVQPPNPAHRPEKPTPVPWVTEDISKNVRKVAQKSCSAQEREWFENILKDGHLLNEKWIVWDGEEGAGGLAGRPAHFTCTDAAGKQWQVNVRVLDVLPADLWVVPSDREARISAEYLLSEEERLRMPRVNFRNDGTAPPHPAWRGCRLLDASEVQSLFWQLPFACS
eukprot:g45043.t1